MSKTIVRALGFRCYRARLTKQRGFYQLAVVRGWACLSFRLVSKNPARWLFLVFLDFFQLFCSAFILIR